MEAIMSESRGLGGRPTKYRKSYVDQAYVLCAQLGATDMDLSKIFGVCESTLANWKQNYPMFLESIKRGKEVFDTQVVEQSLLRRALGYEITEVQTFKGKDGEVTGSKVICKHVAGDVTAMIFWLKNRSPERWRDRQEVAVEHDSLPELLKEAEERVKRGKASRLGS
jgi:hypothetical protein